MWSFYNYLVGKVKEQTGLYFLNTKILSHLKAKRISFSSWLIMTDLILELSWCWYLHMFSTVLAPSCISQTKSLYMLLQKNHSSFLNFLDIKLIFPYGTFLLFNLLEKYFQFSYVLVHLSILSSALTSHFQTPDSENQFFPLWIGS